MARISAPKPLECKALAATFSAKDLSFESMRDLAPLDGWLGQDRALDAIRMASETPHHDFNLYVLGQAGSGRHIATREILASVAQRRAVPDDWVYVNNFAEPHKPKALRLAPGTALRLKTAMEKLVNDLANELPTIFESDDYQACQTLAPVGQI